MGKLLVGMMVFFALLVTTTMSTAHSAAAQGMDESVAGTSVPKYSDPQLLVAADDQYSGGVQYGAGQYSVPDGEFPAIAAGARDAAKDATESAGEGVAAFERGVGAAKLVRKHGITRLPDTGGVSLTVLAAGLALIGGGVTVLRLGR